MFRLKKFCYRKDRSRTAWQQTANHLRPIVPRRRKKEGKEKKDNAPAAELPKPFSLSHG
jgi:hypothetical protein